MLNGNCSRCGAPLKLETAQPFTEADLAGALCPSCTAETFLDSGGAIIELRQASEGARFRLGKVTITGGAVAALADVGQHAISFLVRHVRGDWGENGCCDEIDLTADEQHRGWEATDDPGKVNKWSLLNGRDRIISEYRTGKGVRLWVITSLDRAVGTTVLLPEEY